MRANTSSTLQFMMRVLHEGEAWWRVFGLEDLKTQVVAAHAMTTASSEIDVAVVGIERID